MSTVPFAKEIIVYIADDILKIIQCALYFIAHHTGIRGRVIGFFHTTNNSKTAAD